MLTQQDLDTCERVIERCEKIAALLYPNNEYFRFKYFDLDGTYPVFTIEIEDKHGDDELVSFPKEWLLLTDEEVKQAESNRRAKKVTEQAEHHRQLAIQSTQRRLNEIKKAIGSLPEEQQILEAQLKKLKGTK